MADSSEHSAGDASWPGDILALLRQAGVRQVAYVPDGGHAQLIRSIEAEPGMRAIPLTTEEEGVALACGAWLGGERAVLLMQSSGAGNCLNMLSLVKACRFPFLALVTMRGEWGEFNPWQVPMGQATRKAFELMDIVAIRAETAAEVRPAVAAALQMCFGGGTPVAVLLAQQLIGAKRFVK